MATDLPVWAVIPAAGSGSRMAGDRPKQYLDLDGRSILECCLERLLSHHEIDGAVVVLAADDSHWAALDLNFDKPLMTAIGGSERHLSVQNGLGVLMERLSGDAIVLIHDAARPLVRHDDLDKLINACRNHPAGAILAAPVTDTLHRGDAAGGLRATLARDGLWRALTPQGFRLHQLARALARVAESGEVVTDDAQAVGLLGDSPRLVQGSADNIKITTFADLAQARILWLDQRDQQDHE